MDNNPDLRSKKKEFIKRLNMWEALDSLHTEVSALEHGLESLKNDTQQCEAAFNRLPKISTDDRTTTKSGDKYYTCDIIKLYHKNAHGDIVITNQNQENRGSSRSILANTSLDMLKAVPRVGEEVFAMENERQPWVPCKIKRVYHKPINGRHVTFFELERTQDTRIIKVNKFAVARVQDHGGDLRVPKRVIAGPDKNHMLPGIIGQDACKQNRNRYLVLMDNGSAYYYKPEQVYPILYQSLQPWADFKQLGIQNENLLAELVCFFGSYPKRFIIDATVGQQLEVMRHGVYVPAMIVGIDFDVMKIVYKDRKEDSLYRGSPRFIKSRGKASRLLSTNISLASLFPSLIRSIYDYNSAGKAATQSDHLQFLAGSLGKMNICGGNSARKSTSRNAPPKIKITIESTLDKLLDDRHTLPELQDLMRTPRAAHKCTPDCIKQPDLKTEFSVTDIVAEFRDECDLKVPLRLGWRRILAKIQRNRQISYIYEAPCGKIFTRICDIRRYLTAVESKLDIDYFTLDREVDLSRKLTDRYVYHYEKDIAIDKKTGHHLENKHISLLNGVNEERLPIDFEYNNVTFPHPMLAAKGFSFNEEFKSGCDCEDDCMSRVNCACHRLNEEAAGLTARNRGTIDKKCQYKDKRLTDQISTGVFECNKFCSCSAKCGNRVVQNGIRLRLQVRKTIDKGWGVFVLDDVPKGAFICTYAAELLDDADQYGDSDMYFADLDYITVVESQKLMLDDEVDEGFLNDEDDDSELSRDGDSTKNGKRPPPPRIHETDSDDSPAEMSPSEPDQDILTGEFMPRYPRRTKTTDDQQGGREQGNSFKRLHSILNVLQDYTLDARMQGNIGRFFNHSCDPNAYVQNVFIESHDLRFPTVAFFTKKCLKADDEITWNYNYKIDSIEGRIIECNCRASNCIGRIL